MPAVSNSSPLIFFAAIGRFELLHDIYGEVMVPQAVWRETVAAGAGRAGEVETGEVSWIRRLSPSAQDIASLLLENLDRGESEAIALALTLRPRIPILLDDRRARRVAEEAGLIVAGTAGVLVEAKKLGLVPAFGPLLAALRSAGLYLDDRAANRLMELAGER